MAATVRRKREARASDTRALYAHGVMLVTPPLILAPPGERIRSLGAEGG
jgi:hypothetical protein